MHHVIVSLTPDQFGKIAEGVFSLLAGLIVILYVTGVYPRPKDAEAMARLKEHREKRAGLFWAVAIFTIGFGLYYLAAAFVAQPQP